MEIFIMQSVLTYFHPRKVKVSYNVNVMSVGKVVLVLPVSVGLSGYYGTFNTPLPDQLICNPCQAGEDRRAALGQVPVRVAVVVSVIRHHGVSPVVEHTQRRFLVHHRLEM